MFFSLRPLMVVVFVLSCLVLLGTGCGPDAEQPAKRVPVQPSPTTIEAAAKITHDLPGANVSYSQNTGEISWVTSAGITDPKENTPLKPLAESRGTTESTRAASMLEFFERYKGAFHLSSAQEELQIAIDPLNDPRRPDPRSQAPQLDQAAGLRTQSLARVFKGVRVHGQFATGVFDAAGNLHGLISRLQPIDQSLDVTPSFGPQSVLTILRSAQLRLQTASFNQAGKLSFSSLANDPINNIDETTQELIVLPFDRATGKLGAVTANVGYKLAYEVRLRSKADFAHALIDAHSGEVLEYWSDNRFGWWDEGDNRTVGANDEINNFRFFISTLFDDKFYMAISGKNFVSSWLASDKFVSIDNLWTATDRNKFYARPIEIPATVNGTTNNWNTDTTFNATTTAASRLRHSSALMANLIRTSDWWAARNWNGWDNQGGSFYLAIGMRKGASGEELNAWGGNGTLAIGGGLTSTNQYTGSSIDIVGHEYSHNFVSATTALEYKDESGAVDEALADIFGMALTATGDGFSRTTLGSDIGWNLRDMADPTLQGQPDRYSSFVDTDSDNGGVHTNSGILNKAHGLLVTGGFFNGIYVPKIGMAETEKILRLANVYKSFPSTTSMEDFANGVLDMCAFTNAVNQVFGSNKYDSICKAFKKAYGAVEVLPRVWDLHVRPEWLGANLGMLELGASNSSMTTVDLNKITVSYVDINSSDLRLDVIDIIKDDDKTKLAPGETAKFVLQLPESLRQKLAKDASRLSLRLEVEGNEVPSSLSHLKSLPATVGSDFMPVRMTVFADADQYRLEATVFNETRLGYPAGLEAVALSRTFDNEPLAKLALNREGTTFAHGALPSNQNTASTTTIDLGRTPFLYTANTIELPNGSEVPGVPGLYQAWFDSNGTLPGLNDRTQLYVLADPRALNAELNETNNLVCVNCRVPGQPLRSPSGVIIRLPHDAPVEAMFPAEFLEAARALRASWRLPFEPKQILAPRLNYKPTF